jgi:predicted protein tyrosine phosphatase
MFVHSTRNQLRNVNNDCQGNQKKVLCICSGGLLRSPTVANILYLRYGYNTRSAGTQDYALIPVSEALISWAEEIVVMEQSTMNEIQYECYKLGIDLSGKRLLNLNIPDIYNYMEPELVTLITDNYKKLMESEE